MTLEQTHNESDAGAAVPVGSYVRSQLLRRLQEALDIATGDLSGEFERFRTLLAEVVERAEAVALPAPGPAQPPAIETPPVETPPGLAMTALAQTQARPVNEFLLIPFGEVRVERPVAGGSFVFTRAHAEAASRWFAQMGRKLAIDYEHQSFDRLNTRQDGLRPAAGWIGGLEVRDDGLWAVDVTWTERATELLRNSEYRYFSPVIYWTDEDHSDIAALGPVALTNDPAMHGVSPLAAARERATAETPDTPVVAASGALEAAQEELTQLRRQVAGQAADAFIERGLRLGKILECTSEDWRADYLRDPDAAEQRLSRAPVVLPPGRVLALDRRGEVARRPSNGGTAEASPVWGQPVVEAEDLAAYERATAAGRVRCAGH